MDTKDRIKQIMESQHMTQQVFADFLQQSPATLSSIFNGRTRPTLNIVDAIKAKIPNISIEWLLYGTGEMFSQPMESAQAAISGNNGERQDMLLPFEEGDMGQSTPQNTFHGTPQGALHSGYAVPQAAGMPSVLPGVKSRHQEYAGEEVKMVERTPRKVTEIRVYYDDQTYETFVPAKK